MNSQVSRMEQVVQSYATDNQFMGSILVAQHGHILLDKGYGYANLEWQIDNSPSTFRWFAILYHARFTPMGGTIIRRKNSIVGIV